MDAPNPTSELTRPKTVSEATLRRLPLYHRFLKQVQKEGKEAISCTAIGLDLNLDPTQVRKDIEITEIVGRPKVGYVVGELVDAIERFLGWNNTTEAFLIGAGSLGAALLGYGKFHECGLNIVAAFDSDRYRCNTVIHGKHVLHISKLPELMRRMHIHIGIITVPAAAAQGVADLLVAGEVMAIWNFAPVRLRVPENVIVHNEDLYCSLAALSQKLAQKVADVKKKGVVQNAGVATSTDPGPQI